MSEITETIKVKPWADDQGDHVVINKADFDPKVHELFEVEATSDGDKPLEQMTAAELKALATKRGLTFAGNAPKAALVELLTA